MGDLINFGSTLKSQNGKYIYSESNLFRIDLILKQHHCRKFFDRKWKIQDQARIILNLNHNKIRDGVQKSLFIGQYFLRKTMYSQALCLSYRNISTFNFYLMFLLRTELANKKLFSEIFFGKYSFHLLFSRKKLVNLF